MKRKTFFISALILVVLLLFWAPWIGGDDGSERLIRTVTQAESVKAELEELGAKYSCGVGYGADCCDGMSSSWAPFGRTVNYCQYRSWYIPFWGKKFE